MEKARDNIYDVIVVGAGNAALCSAISAHENGVNVIVLEWAPKEFSGGNSRFTEGAVRFAYETVDDIKSAVPDLSDADIEASDFGTYTESRFYDDLCITTEYRADPELCDTIVKDSKQTVQWMQQNGVRFVPSFGQESFKVDGKHRFPYGQVVEASGGGPGLVEALTKTLEKRRIPILYGTRAVSLLTDSQGVCGVRIRADGRESEIRSRAVVLACGGFEANAEWRARYLGTGWDLAKVRGTRFNMGDGIKMAIEVGAVPHGHWSGCHAVAWDMNAPDYGDLFVGTNFQKHGYPFGIMLNSKGQRFLDEGAELYHYTYAKYGGIILQQPGQYVYQIFDKKVAEYLRKEYHIKQITRFTGNTIEELVNKLDIDKEAALQTIREFNEAKRTDQRFNPSTKDGYATIGIEPAKTNWANKLDTPPYEAFGVTCGITFTYGGLKITPVSEVMGANGDKIPGLFAAGELVGGLYYFNYAGSVGLMAGAIFGRRAGRSAAAFVAANQGPDELVSAESL